MDKYYLLSPDQINDCTIEMELFFITLKKNSIKLFSLLSLKEVFKVQSLLKVSSFPPEKKLHTFDIFRNVNPS